MSELKVGSSKLAKLLFENLRLCPLVLEYKFRETCNVVIKACNIVILNRAKQNLNKFVCVHGSI